MKNMLYTDADFTAVLLVNEEQKGNSISIVVDADDTATQTVVITAGSASQTVTLTASSENTIALKPMYWNFGDVTTLTLNKGGSPAGTITIKFPDKIETDASLYETSTGNYTMQGSNSIEEQIVQLQEAISSISTHPVKQPRSSNDLITFFGRSPWSFASYVEDLSSQNSIVLMVLIVMVMMVVGDAVLVHVSVVRVVDVHQVRWQ